MVKPLQIIFVCGNDAFKYVENSLTLAINRIRYSNRRFLFCIGSLCRARIIPFSFLFRHYISCKLFSRTLTDTDPTGKTFHTFGSMAVLLHPPAHKLIGFWVLSQPLAFQFTAKLTKTFF